MNFSKGMNNLILVVVLTTIFLTSCSTVGNLPVSQSEFISMNSFLEENRYPSFETTLPSFLL